MRLWDISGQTDPSLKCCLGGYQASNRVWVFTNANEREKVSVSCWQWKQTSCSFGKNPHRSCHPVSPTTTPTLFLSSYQADLLCLSQSRWAALSSSLKHFPRSDFSIPSHLFCLFLIQSRSSVPPPAPRLLPSSADSVSSTDTVGLSRETNQAHHPFCRNYIGMSRNQQICCDYQTCCAAAQSCTLIPEDRNTEVEVNVFWLQTEALPPYTTLKRNRNPQNNELMKQLCPFEATVSVTVCLVAIATTVKSKFLCFVAVKMESQCFFVRNKERGEPVESHH